MTQATIRKSIIINASAEVVWGYLTDPDKIGSWFHKPEAAMKQGEVYQMIGKDSGEVFMSGKVLIAEPFTRLEYEFHLVPMGNTQSHVAWMLEEVAGGTQLNLTHTGVPHTAADAGLLLGLDHGWDKHLETLRGQMADAA